MIRRTACLIARERDPYRNLAIEKHLMDTLPEETAILYLWQNHQTVTLGRMQNPWHVCPVDSFTLSGGLVARRLSGGGAMYQDAGCLNFSFLLPKTAFDIPRQLAMVGMAAGAFGIQACSAGRFDLGVSGGSFCRNAFFKSGASAMHHGTLLINAQLGSMRKALNVEEGKLPPDMKPETAHAVNLSDLNGSITLTAMEETLYWSFGRAFGSQPAMLDERMLDAPSIEGLTARFCSREWIFPKAPAYTFSVAERFPWGSAAVQLAAEGGVIRAARLYTDAMEAGLFEQLEQMMVGTPYLISAIAGRFEQKLRWLRDARLAQMADDVCTLICGHIRAMDRAGQGGHGTGA